jgi:hypothetical protein
MTNATLISAPLVKPRYRAKPALRTPVKPAEPKLTTWGTELLQKIDAFRLALAAEK